MHSSPCNVSTCVVVRRRGATGGRIIVHPPGTRPCVESAMLRFGLDIFSLRSQGWTPFEHLDFAAKWGVRVAHYSEIRLLGGLDPAHLKRVRAHADERGIALELGMLSICPG